MSPSTNITASIHQKLLNKANIENRVFNELLQYYAMERFLFRFSESPFHDQLVLKGAFVFRVLRMPLSRPTRDLDFLGFTDNSIENLVAMVKEICVTSVPDDGLVFVPSSVVGKTINERPDYSGVQIAFLGYLGNARINMQLDIGFADVVTPAPVNTEVPTIFHEMAAPHIRIYPAETIVAEKFQAMVDLGIMNSRLKDFYDLWFLSQTVDFSFLLLEEAIQKTFRHRKTDLPSSFPSALMPEFAAEKQVQWTALVNKNRLLNAPKQFETVIVFLRMFLDPFVGDNQTQLIRWNPGHSWE